MITQASNAVVNLSPQQVPGHPSPHGVLAAAVSARAHPARRSCRCPTGALPCPPATVVPCSSPHVRSQWGTDLCDPKQLGIFAVLGLLYLSPALMVR